MILKDKTIIRTDSAILNAGQKQELDVAFYLRRAFKDVTNVFVFNDYKFSFNDETAQIDHLIVYPFGFILIESKSINGEVEVNSLGEWSRSFNGKWQGMASPIKQVSLQQKLLREFLHDNREAILPKFLFNLKQQSFGGRCWQNLCAVSSRAIINRDLIPSKISNLLVKSEFLVDKVQDVMNLKSTIVRAINVTDTRPEFSQSEMKSICDFLITHGYSVKKTQLADENTSANNHEYKATCKSCGLSNSLQVKSGRFGYYVFCTECKTNTALKVPCLSCGNKQTKVSKKDTLYTLNCEECRTSTPFNF